MYIKPCVVVIDETEYWDAPFTVAAAGKIYGVYLFDCCEMTPSYALEAFEAAIYKKPRNS